MKTKLWLLGLLAVLLGGLLPLAQPATAQDIENPKLDLVIIVDESGSMWFDTDKPRERINALNLLMDTLASEGETGDKVRVSLIAFGSAELTEVILPFTPVNSNTVDDIKQVYQDYNDDLANPPNGRVVGLGWTDVLHALNLAEEVFTDPRNGHLQSHKPAIIILTDGKPETDDVNEGVSDYSRKIDQYIDQVFAKASQFQSPPGGMFYYDGPCTAPKEGVVSIYTIAIREGATLDEIYRDIWSKLAEKNGGDYKASPEGLTLGALGGSYYEIWCDLTCCNSRLERITPPMERLYTVSNVYKRIIFTVLKDNPDVEVEIYRPGSTTPITESEDQVIVNQSLKDEVWSIGRSDPWVGNWTVKLTGSGQVWFAYERYTDYFHVEQISPVGSFVKACTPIEIALRLVNSDGQPLTENVADFNLEVRTPDGKIVVLGSITPTDDLFQTEFTDTCMDGEYQLSGLFELTDLPESDIVSEWAWNDTIRVVLDPYLSIVSPAQDSEIHANEAVPLQVDVKVGDKLDPHTATQRDVAYVNIYRDADLVGGSYSLSLDSALGDSRLVGEVPENTLREGRYSAEFVLQTLDNPVPDVRRVEFSIIPRSADFIPPPVDEPSPTPVSPTPTSTPAPPNDPPAPGQIAAIAGLIVALAGLIGGGWWYTQLPGMLGMLLNFDGGSMAIGTGWRRKFPQTKTFPTTSGEEVKLKFSPGGLVDGSPATTVTLVSDLSDAQVKIDDQPVLMQRGDAAVITRDTAALTIADVDYDILTL